MTSKTQAALELSQIADQVRVAASPWSIANAALIRLRAAEDITAEDVDRIDRFIAMSRDDDSVGIANGLLKLAIAIEPAVGRG